MKSQIRLVFILFLTIVGFFTVCNQAQANIPTPTIEFTYVGIPYDIMEVAGTVTDKNEIPELTFIFINPNTAKEFNIPINDIAWSSTAPTMHQWQAWLDLHNLPDGFYHVVVVATFTDGSAIRDALTSDPAKCNGGICVPGAFDSSF